MRTPRTTPVLPTTPAATPRLAELVAAIRAQLRTARAHDPAELHAEPAARRVAAALAGFLRQPDLLTAAQLEPDPHAYRQHLLHVEPDGSFSVVALVWLPGQATRIHDHTAWCVVGTYLGAEEETAYRLVEEGSRSILVPTGTTVYPAGTVTFLTPPGDIHLVRNAGTGKVVSLHVYGTDVSARGTSIRRTYDLPVRSVEPPGSGGWRTPRDDRDTSTPAPDDRALSTTP